MTKPTHGLSPALILLMSVATGLAVASNYYAQPLLDTIARAFNLSASSAGFIVTAAQLGYAAGLLFLVPLGDMFERRMLIVSMTLLAAGGMLITASSQSLAMMILGTALTGLFSVVAQILVPLAATLASPDKRGKVVGTIMSGLLLGILLARTVAGLLASLGGWRTVYWVASESHLTTTTGLILLLLSWVAIWFGHASVLALIVGILVLDLTVQGVHITNQTVIYRVKPDARNRLTAGYMTSYFIGGAAGSLVSAAAWQHAGWAGVCSIGAIVAALNLLVWWRGYHRQEAIS